MFTWVLPGDSPACTCLRIAYNNMRKGGPVYVHSITAFGFYVA